MVGDVWVGVNSYTRLRSTCHLQANKKIHLAYTRYNNEFYIFVNGVRYALSADSAFNPIGYSFPLTKGIMTIGLGYTNLDGSLDDICVIKGTALWTDNFTPPANYLGDSVQTLYVSEGGCIQ